MLGRKKKKVDDITLESLEKIIEASAEHLESELQRIEKCLNDRYADHQKALDDKYNDLNEQLIKENKEDTAKMNAWCEEQNQRNSEHNASTDRHLKHSMKHMTTVEDYVSLQRDILIEIRDCLKVLAQDKMKGGKRVLNDSN